MTSDSYSESYDAGRERAGGPTIVCQHCAAPMHLDVNGWWVDDGETSDCSVGIAGHEVDGWTRVI